MAYVIGCLMAGLSFLVNRLLLKYIGIKVVISYSPVVEELTKTLCAYYLAADILVTHIIFGILEAGYDWFNRQNGQRGIIAALLSIVGHTLFGGLTVFVFNLSNSIFIGIAVGIGVHLVWNLTLIRLSN
ncbi:MAG: hypothetical protein H6Q68_1268 [Firmicutes bacterium]|nr:hypothetical protein [Bacillota bacterium]